ncbi:hypothetical protein FE782_00065 [Paenibacillus antri]|uniref:MrpR N-terminal core-binding domain-containing protein n=1 Tax=Paenibacillus antri TaxID=2582848 RepID=A0A5R9GJU4_9BACL|nr:hypothetical protein [Paenibacillus antri]TLS53794.1 hypothetical protein FE782_00065 [Paenibacillus antri]
MYNVNRKLQFLEDVDDEARPTFERVFDKAKEMESEFGKDLADCSLDELIAVFHHVAPEFTRTAIRNKESIEKYIDWCTEQGYRNEPNPLRECDEEWCYQFVTST